MFKCTPCGKVKGHEEGEFLTFHNRCHLRIHILSHLELDGLSTVALGGAESLQIFPLSEQELNLGQVDDTFAQELEKLHQDYSVQHQNASKCIECKRPVSDVFEHFQHFDQHQKVFECSECKMNLPSSCGLRNVTERRRQTSIYVSVTDLSV